MKKLFILLSAVFVLFRFTANSQEVRFGVTAGMTYSSFHSKYESESYNGKYKTGFTAGILTDIQMAKHFSFQPALNFAQKGFKDESSGNGYSYKATMNLNYLEMPVNFLYNTHGRKGNFFIGAGPSISFGLSGKVSAESGTEKTTEKVNFGSSDEDDLKAVDFGSNILAGYETKAGILFAANYYQGISNLTPGSSDNGKSNNRYFGFKVGYMFGNKTTK